MNNYRIRRFHWLHHWTLWTSPEGSRQRSTCVHCKKVRERSVWTRRLERDYD